MDKGPAKDNLEEMKNELYRRDRVEKTSSVRPEFYSRRPSVSEDWENPTDGTGEESLPKNTMFKKIFFASFIFFVIAIGIAVFLFARGGNVVSSDNVEINILGPVSVAGGDELSLQIAVTNNNNTPLQLTDLVIEYPEGAHDANNVSQELPRYRTSLGVIKSGETVNEIVRAIFFGEEDSEKTATVSVEYRVEGSNAIFVKSQQYHFTISSSPLSLSVKTLKETNTNQEIEVEVRVASNSDSNIDNIALRVDYPFGFEPSSAEPKPTYGTNIWRLGTIKPEQETIIKIRGVMKAQDNEERVFSVYVGKQDEKDDRKIATVYNSSFEQVLVKKPFLGVDVRLNGAIGEEYSGHSGETITADLTWTNNLSTSITDAVIEAKIDGQALDKFSVSVDRGFYNSTTNTIIWNKTSYNDLASIEPGETGRMSFSFSPKSLLSADMAQVRNPRIDIAISARGRRVAEEGAMEEIKEFVKRAVLVNSDLQLTSRAVYYAGPLSNSGPLPPKVGEPTTYTIIWSVVNSSSDVSGARVTASIPSYVNWRGIISPQGEGISFNANTGEVSWSVGGVPAGVGVTRAPREVAFQVSFTPSTSQAGSTPTLVNNIVLSGTDNFTNDTIQYARPALTTNLNTDPSFNQAQAQVVK